MSRAGTEQAFAVLFAVLMMTSMVAGAIAVSGGVAAAPGDVAHRVNAGGSTVDAVDGGPDWVASDGTYVDSTNTYADGSVSVSTDASVPTSTPTSVFQSEEYGDQQWTFSENVQSGQTYEVRLYFAEIYHGVDGGNPGGGEGDRVFDVAVENETVLDGYDIYADVGSATGVMKSYTVSPEDGAINVGLTTVTNNAKISAVEVVESDPEPDTLGGPSSADFGDVVVGDSETETVTVTNLGGDGDADIGIDDVSVSGDGDFSVGAASQTTLAPGESADVPVTFAPEDTQAASATLEVVHSGGNSPLSVELSGEGASSVDPGFQKSTLDGFSAGNPTAIDFGPDGRAYVSTQGGEVYALNVTRTGENSYEVVNEVQIDAINDIPNHDDLGNHDADRTKRQITGLTAGGTADEPVVYVSSSDAQIDVGQDDDEKDTNSGAISRLTISPGSDGELQQSEVDHDVLVLGLPRSEENHAPNGMDLSPDGETLYLAVGGHTNKGAPSDNFGHTPEYALSAAILEIDLAQIENEHQAKSLNDYDGDYPPLDFYYGIPTIQNDDSTNGDDLPFGGNDGINQAKLIEGGPVQIYSAGYRNPYDLVVAESGQVYAADHGPNGGWGGQPADANGDTTADASAVTNHPNEDGSYTTSDQLVEVDEGDYGGHPAPIRANPTQADIYDEDGNVVFDITASNSPVPEGMVNPNEADYIPPTSGSPDPGAPAGSANTMEDQNGNKVLFGPTGGTTEYTASNFGGAMQGDLLQVELTGDVERVQLSADGSTVTGVETLANTAGPLGIAAQSDDDEFAGTVWTADIGGNGVTVLEPVDYGTDGGDAGSGDQCTGADDPSLDEDGDGYDNADEIDAGTDPCSAASTPADFDGDGTSNLNDPDDDNDGLDDTEDPFAVDPTNGVDTTAPVEYDLSELNLLGENGQGWTGVMANGQDDYRDLYDTNQMTVGGAAEVLTVEAVPQGDAYETPNDQQYAFQFGVDTPDEPFVIETTVASFPENPENYQSAGIQIGTGDQSNYVKLAAAANGGDGGVEFAKEVDDSFSGQMADESAVAGGTTTLRMTVDPTTDPTPDNGVDEVAVTAEYEIDGATTEVGTVAMPASWLDTSDGVAPAVGVISTSNGPADPFSATWTDISVDYVTPPENQPPTADAGADQTVDEGDSVALDASNSSDSDGDQLGYTWIQTAGPDAGLSQSDGETTAFTAPDVDTDSTITFQVSVSDGEDSDTDTVNVTVQDTAEEQPPETTVAEAVATGGENDSLIEDSEIQQAINYWATDSEVPDTGGETIGDSQIQQLINYWATGTPVGEPAAEPGAASVSVTPGSDTEASTYSGGSFTVENTGDQQISSVTFDLSSASMPDMVFDPDGTAGDTAAKGLSLDSASGDGVGVVSTGDDVFGQPHNGANGSDGYDAMTVEFTDFDSGESVSFSVDNDPTSIKAATIPSQEAGPVSGLELARSTVSVEYGGSTVQATQLFGDGSAGGAQATLDDSIAPAPSIGVQNVSLDDGALRDHHSAATVSEADQTVTVTGEPGETVTLLHAEGELELSNVPEYDGTPGYDVEPYEANKVEQVSYETVTLDANGEAAVPVTLLDTTDVGGYNYFAATHGEPGSDTGLGSNVVVLKYEEGAADSGDTAVAVNAGGDAYTAADGTAFQADADFDGGEAFTTGDAGTPADPEIANTDDDELYHTERYGNFSYDVPVEDGEYEVTLYFAELYQGVANDGGEGDRLFDVSIEGQQVLDGYDIYAEAGGAHAAIQETFTAEVTDGELNVAFATVEDNAKVSAIEVQPVDSGGDSNAAPTIDAIANQTVAEGNTTTASVTAEDPDGDGVSVSLSGPDFVTLSNGTLTFAPESDDAGTYTVDVTADDGNGGTATESFQLTVEEAPDPQPAQVLHRVNAGEGTTLPATDDGPDWTGVADASSPYLASIASADAGNYGGGTIASTTANVPSSTPDGVWDYERYGNSTWEFDVASGEEVEVRLYLGNSFDGASDPGDRQFNVSVEGQQVLTQYDPVADVGHETGTTKNVTVTDDGDGTITVAFEQGAAENPAVRAIEVVESEGSSQ